jgi:hypothetical protein
MGLGIHEYFGSGSDSLTSAAKADPENMLDITAVNRRATQEQSQKPLLDASVESHPCAKGAQGWGTRRWLRRAAF